jgi:hypothetical protein
MALQPDIAGQFRFPETPCSAVTVILDEIRRAFRENLPDLGPNTVSRAICTDRPGGAVISLGVWGDAGTFTDQQLEDALADTNLLTGTHTAALLVTVNALRLIVGDRWSSADKEESVAPGVKVVFADDLPRITMGDGRLQTRMHGKLAIRAAPDIHFDADIIDRLSLASAGSDPPMQAQVDVDIDNAGVRLKFFILAVKQLLGAIVFWKGDDIAGHIAEGADRPKSPGETLASQWPAFVLTRIALDRGLTGKIAFSWNALRVDERGVVTLGTYAQVDRRASVSIEGPTSVEIRRPNRQASKLYNIRTTDLRPRVDSQGVRHWDIRWSMDGNRLGGKAKQRITFESHLPTRRITVRIEDADGLSATQTHLVRVTVTGPPESEEP